MAEPPAEASGSGSSAAAAVGAAGEAGSAAPDPAAAYRGSVETLVATSLVLMTNLSHAPMVINSPNAASLLTAPVPGTGERSVDS